MKRKNKKKTNKLSKVIDRSDPKHIFNSDQFPAIQFRVNAECYEWLHTKALDKSLSVPLYCKYIILQLHERAKVKMELQKKEASFNV